VLTYGTARTPFARCSSATSKAAEGVGVNRAWATGRIGVRLAELEQEVERLRALAVINRAVGRDTSLYLDDDEAALDLIADDVLCQWLTREPSDPQALTGSESFWTQYADRVEWPPPGSEEEFRAEFCPPDGEPFNREEYGRAAWKAHVEQLRTAAFVGGPGAHDARVPTATT
jgi:hypothetical protein